MAKITRHGGPSDAFSPDRPDELLKPHDGGNPAPEGAVNAGAPEPVAEAPQDDTADVSGASNDDAAVEPTTVELPAANALKSVWEETAIGLGLSTGWVYAEGRTKDQLVSACRGVADGTTIVSADGEPVPSGTEG